MLMAVALVGRRYYVQGTTSKGDYMKFLASLFVITGSSIGLAIFWSSSWGWGVVVVVNWICGVCRGLSLGTSGMGLLPKHEVSQSFGAFL